MVKAGTGSVQGCAPGERAKVDVLMAVQAVPGDPCQCMVAEPGVQLSPAGLARHTAGGGAGSVMAASARRVIHSATACGTSVCAVPFNHRVTTMRSHSSCAAKVAAVQPSRFMQSRSCCGPMARTNARRSRTGRVRKW